MTTYRVSALGSALLRMWRSWTVIVPVVVVNATLQALLVWPDPDVDQWAAVIGLALLSAGVFGVAYGLIGVTALRVPDGRVGWRTALGALRSRATPYAVWALALTAASLVGLAVYVVPGLIVLAVTPFVLLAALDGQPSPLAANLRVIRRRVWRWLVTIVIAGSVIAVGWLVAGFTNFFVRGSAAAFAVWLVGGLVLSWFTTAWALIYRGSGIVRQG